MSRALKFVFVLVALLGRALAAPTITNFLVTSTTATSATVQWNTAAPATTQVLWGTTPQLLYATNTVYTNVTAHSVTIPLLTAGPTYYVAAVSKDGSGSTQAPQISFSLCGAALTPVAGSATNYYQYGSYSMVWVPPVGAASAPNICGQSVVSPVTGNLDGGASFNTQVADASKITPGPGQWQITVTDAGNLAPITIDAYLSSTSQNITAQLQGAAMLSGLTACITNTKDSQYYPAGCGGGGGPGGGVTSLNTLTGAVVLAGNSAITVTPGAGNTLNLACPGCNAGGGTINNAPQYEMGTYVNPGTTNVIGGALKFAELPDTLTPAQKDAFMGTFAYYSGQLVMGTTNYSTPANPYSHAPFTNALKAGILGDRADVPKQPSYFKDYGVQCDAGVQTISTVQGSNQVTFSNPNGTTIANGVIAGMSIGVVGTVSGVPTAWEPIIVSVSGSTATTFDNAPFTVTNAVAVYGHDDTAYVQSVMNQSVGLPPGIQGKPTLPAGQCLVHTIIMSAGPSLQGQGLASTLLGFPGEDIIQLSDPNNPPAGIGYFGQNNPVQDNDFHLTVNTYINAVGTLGTATAWKQVVTLPSVPSGACIEGNFTGCSTMTNTFAYDLLNRHWGRRSPWANNPLGPGYCTGDDQADGGLCIATVSPVTNGSATLCIPSGAPQPTSGDTIVFPYLQPAFKTTIGSQTTCAGGTQFTMAATYPGATSSQQEFMAGAAFQSLNASISSSATSFVGNLAVHPQWFSIDNVGSHGLVQIDSEQMFYRVVVNESNTFLNLTRGVNGTTAASHSSGALIVPLNPVEPSRPWPVIPSLTVGTATTPVGAEFYPAGGVGNAAYAMPLLSGNNVSYVGIGDGSYLRNITMDTVNGVSDNTNKTAGLWISQLPYSVILDRLYITGTDFGSVMSPPTNNYNYMVEQSSCNAIAWNKITIRANHGWYNLCGGQASFANMDIYNTLGVVGWAQWAEPNDQGSGQGLFGGGDNIFNVYNEDNGGGGEGISEPEDALFASNDTINNAQWVASNIFILAGQGNQGSNVNFPNGNVNAPLIIYGQGNTLHATGALGPATTNSNVYGTGTVLNYGNVGGNNVDGASAGGEFFNVSVIGTGSRQIAGFQTGESALLGNVLPSNQFLDLNSGLIYPGEIEVKVPTKYFNSMDGLITDSTALFNAAVYCKGSSTSCQPQYFVPCVFSCGLGIAAGSRIIPGTYTVYIPYRTNTGTPTSTIALQVWTGGVATTVATSSVTNSTSWQVLEFDNVSLSSYSGYTIGLLVNTFSSSSANYYIGGIEMSPLAVKFQAQEIDVATLKVTGSCTGCGGGGGLTKICSGTITLSGTVNNANQAVVGTDTCTGALSTDAITQSGDTNFFNITGFAPSTTGGLTVQCVPSANTVTCNAKNDTANPLTIGSGAVVNYYVAR